MVRLALMRCDTCGQGSARSSNSYSLSKTASNPHVLVPMSAGVGVLLGSVGQLARVSGALERVAALMSRQPNPGSLAGSVRPDTVVGRLELRNLGFKYREDEGATWALKDVSFTVERGSVVALVRGFYKRDDS
jgi:ABC-type multidrug transport system fused ATPase/permease subunit